MNRTRKMILGLGILAFGGSMVMTGSAAAYKGDPTVKGPNYSAERHTAIEKAFETNDYALWKSLVPGKGKVTEVINESNFAKFAEAHRLALSGDMTGAEKIRQELGLNMKDGMRAGMKDNLKNGKGMGNGFGKGRGTGNYTNR